MIRYSVLMPCPPGRPEQVVPFAALVRDGYADRLWQGQSLRIEPHQMFAYAAAAGYRIPVGTAVTLMPLRHPFESAVHAASLAATMGAPVVAGFGTGAGALQASLCGAPYRSPLRAAREYLAIVRGLLCGVAVSHRGEYFTCHSQLPPLQRAPIELGLGVLRPRMARLAGELADVAITWLTPPAYLARRLVPALADGAATAGRHRPRLVAVVPVALAAPDRDPADLALAACWAHLRAPHYRAMLRQAGVPVDIANGHAAAGSLVDADAFVCGSPAAIGEALDAYQDAGVDEVVLNATGVAVRYGLATAALELQAILAARTPTALTATSSRRLA
jgi:5,10-methylenetetrahydromethanopterin reductase